MSRWMIPNNKLSGKQRDIIDENSRKKENIWIKGFAGSGKSVLLVHTMLDKMIKNPNATICIVVFTHSLIEMFKAGMQELGIANENILLTTYHQFMKNNYKYDYIFCDEVQDLTKTVLENMKLRAGQLIVAGDSNQSIYPCDPATKESTLTSSEIDVIMENKSVELKENFRLPKSIRKAVGKFILAIRDMFSSTSDRTKDNITIKLYESITIEKEIEYIFKEANDDVILDESVVILLPTHNDIIDFINNVLKIEKKYQWLKVMDKWGNKPDWYLMNRHLKSNGINIEYVGNGKGNLYSGVELGKIIIMTYHSSKGLDFDTVFLPFMSENARIYNKSLFMVGMTRSKNDLYLTYTGTMHKYIKSFEDECTKIDNDTINNDSNNLDLDFDF